MLWKVLILILPLAACEVAPLPSTPSETASTAGPTPSIKAKPSAHTGLSQQDFANVVSVVRPVAVQQCRRRTTGINCDFAVVIHPNKRAKPRAYQSQDKNGRPILTFTSSMISKLRNEDELAFILGHEAAHHISNHLIREQQFALSGAAALAGLAKSRGDSAAKIARAKKAGATIGALTFSKEFELEADELGAMIAHRAGFNPWVGAQFFNTIPDPGDEFLGTHPPTAARLAAVRRVSARLGVRE